MKNVILETKIGPQYLHQDCINDVGRVLAVRPTRSRRNAAKFGSDLMLDDAINEINQRLAIGLCSSWLSYAR